MSTYSRDIDAVASLVADRGNAWDAISPESVARMKAQNRFQTGLDIAKYTADIMRSDMDRYDADPAQYTQSLGCWHGFIGQQKNDLH
jgi:isocitrate lyase